MRRVNSSLRGARVRWAGLGLMLFASWFTVPAYAFAPVKSELIESRTNPLWQLMDYHQTACFDQNVDSNFYGIWIRGAWTHSIDVGLANLPKRATFSTIYAPIPPGSSKGEGSLAYVRLQLAMPLPVGQYSATLWANDGSVTETVPVILDVRTSCGY